MIVSTEIVCDLTAQELRVVDVSQNDNRSRAVACRLRANGESWAVPEGVTAAVSYVLPDGTPGEYDVMPDGSAAATIEGSTVTVMLLDRIMSQAGAAHVSVVLRRDGAQLATFPFRVRVIGNNILGQVENLPALGAGYEGLLLYGGPGGVLRPLRLGPGLSIRDGVLYVSGGTDEPEEPVGVVTAEVDEDGTFRVYLDGVEVAPVVDDAGNLTWPGLAITVDDAGDATLVKEA